MLAIYKKEMRSYFINPVGFVFVGVFLTVAAALCTYTTLQSHSYSTSSYFFYLVLAMIVLIPLLTMRMFAEEKKLCTEQMLLTAPINLTAMVGGKFLAAFTLFAGCMTVSLINFFPLYVVGRAEAKLNQDSLTPIGPVSAEIVGSFIGVLLIGAAFIAIGLLISALTENQLAAAVMTIAVLVTMLVLNILNSVGTEAEGTRLINNYVVRYVIDWISIVSRFTNFQYGILDWASLLYYISVTFVFLYLTVRVYDRRRWA